MSQVEVRESLQYLDTAKAEAAKKEDVGKKPILNAIILALVKKIQTHSNLEHSFRYVKADLQEMGRDLAES